MTIDEAIQILNLYDLGNMFLDIDGNPIGYEKMSSACDMAVEALRISDRFRKRMEELEGKLEKNLSLSEATEYHAIARIFEEGNE